MHRSAWIIDSTWFTYRRDEIGGFFYGDLMCNSLPFDEQRFLPKSPTVPHDSLAIAAPLFLNSFDFDISWGMFRFALGRVAQRMHVCDC